MQLILHSSLSFKDACTSTYWEARKKSVLVVDVDGHHPGDGGGDLDDCLPMSRKAKGTQK